MQLKLLVIYFQYIIISVSLVRGKSISERTSKKPIFKYTIEELLSNNFPKKSSNDLDLDPCKAGKNPPVFGSIYIYV